MAISITQQNSIWKKILTMLEFKLSNDRHMYETFFAECKLVDIDDEQMTILTPSLLSKKFLSSPNAHSQMLNDVVSKVTGKNYKLTFILEGENKPINRTNSFVNIAPKQTYNYFSNCKINKRYTFDNFVVGNCNREAVRASLLIANNPGNSFNPLFIYSKSGLGKTHLLHSIANYYQEKHPDENVLYITTDAFIDEFVRYVQGSQDNQSLKEFFNGVDLLLVDDIQFLSDKQKTAEMFFYIFNALVNNGKQIVLTSDRHPKDLKGLEERLVSRFNMGLSVNMQTPDSDTMLEILRRKIIANNLDVKNFDEEGLVFLAETFSKNVRELEGALNRLLFHTVSIKGDERITLEDIQDAVSIMMPSNNASKGKLTEEEIIEIVANYYNISTDMLKSKSRKAQIALARRIAMYLCRSTLNSSYKRLGQVFKRDHSTVITGVEKVDKELKKDTQLAEAISTLKKALKK